MPSLWQCGFSLYNHKSNPFSNPDKGKNISSLSVQKKEEKRKEKEGKKERKEKA
jgi:hypothetical protein